MGSLPAEIVTAVALFAGTNVDDLVVLSLLSASSWAGGHGAGRSGPVSMRALPSWSAFRWRRPGALP
jgi:hypothetical protein